MSEPILDRSTNRWTTFPLKHHDLWDAYITHRAAFWVETEIDYSADIADWDKLTADEKYFVEHILAFFAGSDGIVLENLVENFSSEVTVPEARAFYAMQSLIETVHGTTYSLLIDTLVKSPERKAVLFDAIDKIPCVGRKAGWAAKWMAPDRPFAERLVAFAIVEGLFFAGSFCAIFWLKSRGVMTKALGVSNELIARDEGLHTDFAILLYHKLQYTRLSESRILEILVEAVDIETQFICDSIPCSLIGMNKTLMTAYIQFVADRLLVQLGCRKHFGAQNPFEFMDTIALTSNTNFFEKRVSDYKTAVSVVDHTDRKNAFDGLDDDF